LGSHPPPPKYRTKSGPRKITVIVLLAILAVTPIYMVLALAVNIPFFPFFSSGAPSSSVPSGVSPIIGPTSTAQVANTSALCSSVTKYHGVDSTNPSDTSINESFPIFSVRPGSTTEICLSFYNHDNPEQITLNLGDIISIGNFQAQTFVNGTTVTKFVSAAPDITVTPAQPTLILSGSTAAPFPAGGGGGTFSANQATVAFQINAGKAATGTYFMDIKGDSPAACQGEFRIAVGLNFTRSNSTGPYFALPSGMGSCTAGLGVFHDHVLGVEGIGITYLTCNMFSCDLNQPPG
jgi:hypothetical protein